MSMGEQNRRQPVFFVCDRCTVKYVGGNDKRCNCGGNERECDHHNDCRNHSHNSSRKCNCRF